MDRPIHSTNHSTCQSASQSTCHSTLQVTCHMICDSTLGFLSHMVHSLGVHNILLLPYCHLNQIIKKYRKQQ